MYFWKEFSVFKHGNWSFEFHLWHYLRMMKSGLRAWESEGLMFLFDPFLS